MAAEVSISMLARVGSVLSPLVNSILRRLDVAKYFPGGAFNANPINQRHSTGQPAPTRLKKFRYFKIGKPGDVFGSNSLRVRC